MVRAVSLRLSLGVQSAGCQLQKQCLTTTLLPHVPLFGLGLASLGQLLPRKNQTIGQTFGLNGRRFKTDNMGICNQLSLLQKIKTEEPKRDRDHYKGPTGHRSPLTERSWRPSAHPSFPRGTP